VRVINSLIEGLLFQRFLTPELMPDEVFYAAFAALAGQPPSIKRARRAPPAAKRCATANPAPARRA
jgi:hypothetical protein